MSINLDAVKLKTALYAKIVSGGSLQEVAGLLNQGVSILEQDLCGDTLLYCATWYQRKDIVELLVMRGAQIDSGREPPLFAAVAKDDTAILHLLLQHKAQINYQDIRGNTPLHCAVGRGCVETARLLLASKADYNLENRKLKSPRMLAFTPKMRQLVEEQIEKDNASSKLTT